MNGLNMSQLLVIACYTLRRIDLCDKANLCKSV